MFPGTLSLHAQKTLALLGKQDFLKSAYLAGGSSLALQLGHRRSIDFDFFTNKEFESINIKKKLQSIGQYKVKNETPKTMVGESNKLTLLKALQYFEDANGSDMPEMIKKVDWEEVKEFFRKEVLKLADKYLK